MGFTRYWKSTGEWYDEGTVEKMKKIISVAEEKYGIDIFGWDGEEPAHVDKAAVSLNGDRSKEYDHETFLVQNGKCTGRFDFCKTARKPYDAVVNAILQLLEREGVVTDVSSDGPNEEALAKELLSEVCGKDTGKVTVDYDIDCATPMSMYDNRLRVDWVNLNEGNSGDYDPNDQEDTNYLRFDVFYQTEDGVWEALDDASYCTCVPADTSRERLKELLRVIFDRYSDADYLHSSVKKLGEELSYLSA